MNQYQSHSEAPASIKVSAHDLCRPVAAEDFAAAVAGGNASCIVYPGGPVPLKGVRRLSRPFPAREAAMAADHYEARQLSLHVINDAIVFGSGAFFADGNRRVVEESVAVWGGESREGDQLIGALRKCTNGRFKSLQQPATGRIEGINVFASSYFEDNYFHWHHDIMLALMFAYKILGGMPFNVIVGKTTGFAHKSLRAFGIPSERIIALQTGTAVTIERLLFLSVAPLRKRSVYPGILHPQIRDVFQRVKSGLWTGLSANTARRKLFVSRGTSDRRLLVNREELEKRFEALGFDVVDPGTLSYEVQIGLFSDAAVVVGEHGGAMANIGFCRPGALVVELFHPLHHDLCYHSLAAITGLRHAIFVGEVDVAVETPERREWSVDIDAAVAFVEEHAAGR